jgi:hypothetical protein
MTTLLAALLSAGLHGPLCLAQSLPAGYWSLPQANEILDKTRNIELDPDLSALSGAERAAVDKLLQAGAIFNRLYEDAMHPQAVASLQTLQGLGRGSEQGQALLDLYYQSEGPITTTLDNQRVPFLPVAPEAPGKNLYPPGMSAEQLDAFMRQRPAWSAELLALRTVVRANDAENLQRDLAMLDRFPLLDGLHPGLRQKLEALRSGADDAPFYALPYSVRWAPDIVAAAELINGAAGDVRPEDPDLAAYLSLRARDLLSDDYEAGDAAWVRGQFRHLNAQIGSFETYGDALYGVKSFFSLSVLLRDVAKSDELAAALGGLQAIQDQLPMAGQRKVQQDIPVGVYNIVADFGQSRGGNTASILPNEADHARKYGRTILLRYNIMSNPDLFADAQKKFQAAVIADQGGDLGLDGPFYRTLWHEVGHYLGVDRTSDGRDLDEALSPWGNLYEEMKADLVSAFTAAQLNSSGLMSDATLRSVQAAGVLRVLQKNQPRPDQPYQTMQLMQMNYFLEQGLLRFDQDSGRLTTDYARYPQVIARMLGDVLAIQAAGDRQRATAFIEKYTAWTPELHERLAERLRQSSPYQFLAVRYRALQPTAQR